MKRLVVGPSDYRLCDQLTSVVQVPGVPGLTLSDAWRTQGAIDNQTREDMSLIGAFSVAPKDGDTLFRVITFPPKSVLDAVPPDVMSQLGAEAPPQQGNLMWHQTATIDYISILSGRIELVTEQDRQVLDTGDVAIVRGVLHAWTNPDEAPCVMSCVSIGTTT